jgi:hypothetical protein
MVRGDHSTSLDMQANSAKGHWEVQEQLALKQSRSAPITTTTGAATRTVWMWIVVQNLLRRDRSSSFKTAKHTLQ